ncbi:hypothetical protein BGZ57DRAFT_939943 [Hyaloscypha finlandica]|nr:hypothetical protein BGZ57DRAFT_939943 [Hyaloscypha finlandica]
MVGSKDLQPSAASALNGKTAIITGSNNRLAYEAALPLLDLKLSHLIMAVRNSAKGEAAAAKLRQSHPKARIEVWLLDMSSYSQLSPIDILILNAGVKNIRFNLVKSTGHEEVFQVNYLSTMLLTLLLLLLLLLLPILKAKGPPGEPAHLTISPNRDANPLFPSFNDPMTFSQENYNSSKLLAHMFLWNLVDYVNADDVIINISDPAWVKGTELLSDAKGEMWVGLKVFEQTGRTPKVGSPCLVDAVLSKGKVSHGCFLMSWEIHPFAAFLYTPEGKVVIQRVWDETLAELDFAGVGQILESMKA